MQQLQQWLVEMGLQQEWSKAAAIAAAFVAVLVLAWMADLIARGVFLHVIHKLTKKTRTIWDDILVERKLFKRLSHLAPAIVIYLAAPIVFADYETAGNAVRVFCQVYMVMVGLFVIDSVLSSVVDIYRTFEFSHKTPIRGIVQGIKVVIYIFGLILIISILFKQNPLGILGGLGAMTAVLLLIFKDSILGLVAGIQLSANQMVRIGDWIEMPKYGADGDVIDITLTTVKVQNWDKTISTIPAYSLVTDSFKNWRGMSESGGRRIKRSLYIDMTSVKFCDERMLDKFRRIQYISEYINQKKRDIDEHNRAANVDDSALANGRRMTNLGTFRAYITAYLRNHPMIHPNMTFLVRHLEPTPTGLPIQIYVFSKDQVWANYEGIQADIFDHILAVVPEFELRVFQNPTGSDFQSLLSQSAK